jgi:hypothetical protein
MISEVSALKITGANSFQLLERDLAVAFSFVKGALNIQAFVPRGLAQPQSPNPCLIFSILPYVRKTRKHPIHMETKCICAESI